jgi:hypothetical protein
VPWRFGSSFDDSVLTAANLPALLWHTGCAMLIEIWERLRGYDKWIETEARVESSKVIETPDAESGGIAYSCEDVLVWADRQGENQRAYFAVPDGSPLYQFIGGETIKIRYNPAEPDEYYLRELLKIRVRRTATGVIVTLVFIGICISAIWMGARQPSH